MLKRCLVQYVFGENYFNQIKLTIQRTVSLCNYYRYDYRLINRPPARNCTWERVLILKELIIQGYDQIFWLDSDTYWNKDIPLHAAFERETPLHMTFHEACNSQGESHFNAGVMFLKNIPSTLPLLQEWWHTPDDGHAWTEQHALNKLIFKNGVVNTNWVTEIPHTWNSTVSIPEYTCENPIIMAWHGCANSTERMKEFLNDSH